MNERLARSSYHASPADLVSIVEGSSKEGFDFERKRRRDRMVRVYEEGLVGKQNNWAMHVCSQESLAVIDFPYAARWTG